MTPKLSFNEFVLSDNDYSPRKPRNFQIFHTSGSIDAFYIMNRRKLRLARTIPSLSDSLAKYCNEVSSRKKGAAQERSVANVWRRTLLANRPLDRISQSDIQKLRDEWLEQCAPATVTRRLALLSHVYTVAIKDWAIAELTNPVKRVRWPQANDSRTRRIYDRIAHRGIPIDECPRSELDWLKRYTRSRYLPIVMLLAVETGMRRSEIVTLTRKQIDMPGNVITLTKTKNGTERYVPITPFAKAELRKHLNPMLKPNDRIFDVSASAISQSFARAVSKSRDEYEKLCKRYNRTPRQEYFRDLRFHDLRHEATSILATVYPRTALPKAIGLSSERMLQRYYNPKGRDLVRILMRSKLAKKQNAILRAAAQNRQA